MRRLVLSITLPFSRSVMSAGVLAIASTLPLVSIGCQKKEQPTTSTEVTPPTVSAMVSASAALADAAAAMTENSAADAGKSTHMANCPAAAPSAAVAIKDIPGGVEVAITGSSDAVTKDIRERMTKLVEADRNEAEAGVRHTGHGEGGGRYGRCTIVMRNTKLESAEIPGGVKATVKAKDDKEVDWLRRETRERDKETKASGADNAGTRRMAHCPSAVEGAKTTVKDTSDGVVITVTGSGSAVQEIRDRAKHTSDIAKLPEPPKIEHNSEGKGGGGLGRCPVVVEGDTSVDAKDVEGGSEITVKAKKDVASLQKEAKLRAGNFPVK